METVVEALRAVVVGGGRLQHRDKQEGQVQSVKGLVQEWDQTNLMETNPSSFRRGGQW